MSSPSSDSQTIYDRYLGDHARSPSQSSSDPSQGMESPPELRSPDIWSSTAVVRDLGSDDYAENEEDDSYTFSEGNENEDNGESRRTAPPSYCNELNEEEEIEQTHNYSSNCSYKVFTRLQPGTTGLVRYKVNSFAGRDDSFFEGSTPELSAARHDVAAQLSRLSREDLSILERCIEEMNELEPERVGPDHNYIHFFWLLVGIIIHENGTGFTAGIRRCRGSIVE